MVLINELTVEQINAALLHLQRSKDEVVGGNKGTTIQNITISNSGGGGGNNVDYSGTIKNLANAIDKNTTAIEKNASDIAKLKSNFSNIEKSVEDTLQGLVDNGISDLSFDPLSKQLTISTNDGNTYQTVIEQDIGYLSYDSTTNKLILTTGNQSQEITLPYIKASEKGSANGVATLDENGRVPYSQLPESAMEFLGQWNASTNTPHLADGTGTNGDFYIVSTGGTVNLGTTQNPHIITFSVNDRIVYEGDIAQWVRLPAGQVSSVNGQSGAVVLTASDINYSTGVTIKDKIDANAVQADWNVSDTSSLAYIKNKPTIPSSPVQSDWNISDTTSLAYIKNKPSLATVATSGSYTDLSNKPTIPAAQIQSDWTCTSTSSKAYIKNKPTLATVATSGEYSDLTGTPTLGTAAECDASCFRASTWNPNMNNVGDAANVYVAQNTVCRKIIMTNTISDVGGRTRVGIGLQRGTGGWGVALLSVGTNDVGTTFYDYKFSNTGVLTAARFCGNLCGTVSYGGSTLSGYTATVPSPANTTHYVLVNVGNAFGGNVVAQIYTSKYFISKSDSSSRVVTDGANYGGLAYSHLGTEASPSTCIWLCFTGWRPMLLCGECPITIVCNTTTAPSGVSFTSPEGVCCAAYLSTYEANGSDNISSLKAVFDTVPKSVGTAVRLQHGSHSMAFGWFLRGYTCANAYGGWFVSDYNIPKFVGINNGGWTECTIITSGTIGSQTVASADAVHYSALLDTSDKSYPLVFSSSNVACGYVSLKGNINSYFCCCYTCPTNSYFQFHAQIKPTWRLLETPTFTCNQGSDTGTNWFLCCACIDDTHQKGQVEVWNCANLTHGKEKIFSITLPVQLCPIRSAVFTYMYDSCGNYGGPELSAFVAGTCKICFGVYNRNSGADLCRPHFLLQWWY